MGRETEESSYIIFKDGNLYKAKNGTTGCIEFSGADAATVIQSAIDALPAEGGIVFIKTGNYYITKTLQIFKSNVWLKGEGRASTLFLAGNVDMITMIGGEAYKLGIKITDLSLNGEKGKGYTSHGIRIGGASRVLIDNCIIAKFGGDGIRIEEQDTASSYACWITRNWIADVDGYGILLRYNEGTSIVDNDIEFTGKDGIRAVTVVGAIRIADNVINEPAENGIYLWGVSSFNIIGNHIWAPNHNGILVVGGGDYQHIIASNEIINASKAASGTYDGIEIGNARNGIIIGNLIGRGDDTYVPKYCVELLSESVNWTVIGNRFRRYATAPIRNVGTGNFIKAHINYESSGTATFTAGATNVTISHGLATIPKIVLVTPHHSEITDLRVIGKTATGFTVEVSTAPTTDRTFDWYAEV